MSEEDKSARRVKQLYQWLHPNEVKQWFQSEEEALPQKKQSTINQQQQHDSPPVQPLFPTEQEIVEQATSNEQDTNTFLQELNQNNNEIGLVKNLDLETQRAIWETLEKNNIDVSNWFHLPTNSK
jgi:uncharacterized protein YdiU (UPF0061 family)